MFLRPVAYLEPRYNMVGLTDCGQKLVFVNQQLNVY